MRSTGQLNQKLSAKSKKLQFFTADLEPMTLILKLDLDIVVVLPLGGR